MRGERLGALGDPVGEDGRGVEEVHRHAGPLGSLTGEDEDQVAGGPDGAAHQGGVFLVVRQGGERGVGFAAAADHDGAVLQRGPGGGQGVADVQRVEAGEGAQLGRPGTQRLRAARGERPRHDGRGGHRGGRGVGLGGGVGLLGFRCLLQDDVAVGAADAEGGDGGAADPVHLGPRLEFGGQPDRARLPVDLGRGPAHVQGGRHLALAHGLHHLDDAADSGGGLGVADVRLQRAEEQRLFRAVRAAVGGEQRLRLDGVAERGAGAVRLDDVDVGRGQPGVGQRLPDDPLLGGSVGRGEPGTGAVLVDGGAADQGEHGVAAPPGVAEPLQQEDADALAPAGAVGVGAERLAAAVGGQASLPAHLGERDGGRHHHGAAGHGERALLGAQGLDRQVQRDQRRRAGGVDADRRALEAEGVGDAAGGDAVGVASGEESLDLLGHPAQPGAVVLVLHAGEDADPGAALGLRVDAGPLERLPGGLQEQPLLRVHRERLVRRDTEELWLEAGDVVEEAAFAGVAAVRPAALRVVQPLQVPAAVVRERGDGVRAGGDHAPQVLGAVHTARVAAGHAHDGDGLRVLRLELGQTLTRAVQIGRDPLEVSTELVVVHCCPSTLFGGHDMPSSLSMKEKISSSSAASRRSSTTSSPAAARALASRSCSRPVSSSR